jgi:hypothetical protein
LDVAHGDGERVDDHPDEGEDIDDQSRHPERIVNIE